MKRPKPAAGSAPASKPFHNPFAGLQSLKGALPSVPAAESAPAGSAPPRAVVRLERKGRGGKEVTVVEQLDLKPQELARWHQELKRLLGCGGSVEGDALVFQGDQRPRLKAALTARGVRRISGS